MVKAKSKSKPKSKAKAKPKAKHKTKSKSKHSAKQRMEKTVDEIAQETWCAALSYLLVGMLWFAVDDHMKKNSFVKFHVKQALVIFIIGAILSIVSGILSIFLLIPIINIFFGIIIAVLALLQFALIILAIIGIVHSFLDKKVELPFIGIFAKKLRF